MNDQSNPTEGLTSLVLNHYLHHHELVLRKLKHAQEATQTSLKRLEDAEAQEEHTLEELWGDVLALFKDFAPSECDLFEIERLLGVMPQTIKELYDILVENDQAIQRLIEQMNTEEYLKAVETITKVQAEPNPMSGLRPEDYDVESADSLPIGDAIKYSPYMKSIS